MSSIIPSKCCSRCKQTFPATNEYFHRLSKSTDGLRPECKQCRVVESHSYYLKNAKRIQTYVYMWRKQNREKCNQYNERWKQNHRDIYLAGRHRRYIHHAEANRKFAKEWRQNNPEKLRIYWKVRQARKRSSGETHTPADIRQQHRMQKGLCWWCGKPLEERWAVDHRIPLAKGGSNGARNIVIAHLSCNQSKKDKMPWEWNGRLL